MPCDPEGNIVIRGTDLAPGTQAEVIVLVEPTAEPDTTSAQSRLDAFRALQAAFKLDRATAERWAAETRTLREWNRPRE